MSIMPMYVSTAAAPLGSPMGSRTSLRQSLRSSARAFEPGQSLRSCAQAFEPDPSFAFPMADQPMPMKIDLKKSGAGVPRLMAASRVAAPEQPPVLAKQPPGLARPRARRAPAASEQPCGALMPLGALLAAAPRGASRKAAHEQEGSECCSTSAGLDDFSSEASLEAEKCTTMAVLNIPYTYPKWKLQRWMETQGYAFNYFHFPKDSRRGRNRGFAFVNFTTPEIAQAFRQTFDKMALFHPGDEEKAVTVVPSSLQGFERNRALHPGAEARPLKMA